MIEGLPFESNNGKLPTGAVLLRDATEADVPTIARMGLAFARASSYGPYFVDSDADILERFESRARDLITQDGRLLYVVQHGDALAGMMGGMVGPHPLLGTRTFFEVMLWIEPAYRHGRTFPMLMLAMENAAKHSGCGQILCGAPDQQFTGILSRLGYNPVEVTMVKRLGEEPSL